MKATRTIWKTVVFAGAMLGTAACGPKSTAPAGGETSNVSGGEEATPPDEGYGDPCASADPCADPCASADPCADPCRGRGDEEEPCAGRGFILS